MSNIQICLIFILWMQSAILEYIPPGPKYKCPKETDSQLLYPCICKNGTDIGLIVQCENVGLAALSVGIGNIAGLGLPIDQLWLKECKISHLFGSLLHRSSVHTLHIVDTPLQKIDDAIFMGVNRTLQRLYMTNTKLPEFPKESLKILGNLIVLSIDGHLMTKLEKDAFLGPISGKLERLHLSNGLISDMAADAFQNLKKLKTLDLHGNKLATLKRNQFKGLRDAELLDISHNNITKLDGTHIGDLTKLGWCNASHNLIADIPRGMFSRNTVLKVLHLNNNRLKKLDTNSLRGMRFLRRLYLQDNQINDVGRGTFSSVNRIGTVDLARNKLTKVDFQMFQQVKYAEIINLAENDISVIETQAFTDLYLATVNISHNKLSKIEFGSFQNCNNLTLLDLSHNMLVNITKGAFDENSYAGEFVLTHNLIEDFSQIPIHNMTGIRLLNASHNQIARIPKNAFPKLYELHTVDLSYNNLTDINNAVFQTLFSLRYLNMSHNPMRQIKIATFGTLPTLLELDLSYNLLQQVSKGSLAKLASCRLLDVSHNQLDGIFQIPISLGELNLAYNNISKIPINTWPTMNALLRLNLSSNTLDVDISEDSYRGLITLQSLDLSNNSLTTAPWRALSVLTSLQYLYLNLNNITALSKSAFGNLPTLFKLDLSYNQISEVGSKSFMGLQQLLDLSLRGNSLYNIPNEAFKGLVALRKLDLSHNYLERIDNKTNGLLEDCLSLESIDLSYNNFSQLTKIMFPTSPWIPYRLVKVNLSHNRIPILTKDFTFGTKKIKYMDFSYNGISDIRSYVLSNISSLEVLDLSHNKLTKLTSITADLEEAVFSLPENMTEIYLKNNKINELPVKSLANLKKIKVLDVRSNSLDSLDRDLVKRVAKNELDVLFEDNKLICDCKARPLKHYLNRFSPTDVKTDVKYTNISCHSPTELQGVKLIDLDEDRLYCSGGKNAEDGNTDSFDFVDEPDVMFRDVQFSQTSIYVNWYVNILHADIGDFIIYIQDSKQNIIYEMSATYNIRSATIKLDKALQNSLKINGNSICIQAKTSENFARKWHPVNCKKMELEYSSWPKKLALDKRRLTNKQSRSGSVLLMLSDSILITYCIFLGACFRQLANFDI